MLVLVIIAFVALGAAIRDPSWIRKKNSENDDVEITQGLWTTCLVSNANKSTWSSTCTSSTSKDESSSLKTKLRVVQITSILASILLTLSLVLSIVLTCRTRTHDMSPKTHMVNSVVLILAVLLLLVAGGVYVAYNAEVNHNEEKAGVKKSKLSGGFLSLVIALLFSIISLVLCALARHHEKITGGPTLKSADAIHPANSSFKGSGNDAGDAEDAGDAGSSATSSAASSVSMGDSSPSSRKTKRPARPSK